jgi:pimeloyl-ACP methyl ester carboxylesterase
LCGAQIQQPTLFVAGEVDAVLTMYPDAVAKLEQAIPNLTKKVILPGAGHWIQQERPTEVNRLLMEFLGRV